MTNMIRRSPSFNSALDYWMQTLYEHPPNSSDPTLHNHIDDISCPDISYATHLPLSDQLAASSTNNTPSATKTKVNQVSEDEKQKPINRRRYRACKKSTPTTHLNATAKNFKDLVQQYTGCPPPFALIGGSGKLKGPVTLNFGQGRLSSYDQEQGQNYASTFMGSSRVSSTSYVHGIKDQLKRRDNQVRRIKEAEKSQSAGDCFDANLSMPETVLEETGDEVGRMVMELTGLTFPGEVSSAN